MRRRKKENKKSTLVIFLVLVLLIVVAMFVNAIINPKGDENAVNSNNTVASNLVQEPVQEESIENTIDRNNLAEDEASFGELTVPVYKIEEKSIKIPLLIYHGFSTPEPTAEEDVYKLMCTEDRFEDQITTLLNAGYTFLTLEDIYKYDKGLIGLPEKNVTITMDDGWEGNYTEAFDIIKKYKVPATIFIVEDLVGTPGYFTWEQAKEMYDSGLVKIHVHGRKHVDATQYSKKNLIADYNHAHEAIEEALGTEIPKIMAYPAGASNENTIAWLEEAGFEVQVQTKYGTVNKSSSLDLTGLGRIRAEKTSGASILRTIESAKTN